MAFYRGEPAARRERPAAAGARSPALPDFMRRPPPRFPLAALRPAYLAAAIAGYALADRLP